NYLLQEMGFRIARKHRIRLRLIARITAFVLPALLSLIALFTFGAASAAAAALAVVSAALGLVVERWLFFAEAKHTVMLYYGADIGKRRRLAGPQPARHTSVRGGSRRA